MEDKPEGQVAPGDGEGTPRERRPSLAERLMNPPVDATPGVRAGSIPDAPERPTVAQAMRDTVTTPLNNRAALPAMNLREPELTNALKEARRYVRVRYYSFLTTILVLFATLVISAGVLVASLLSDAGWEQLAASGAVAGGALLGLLLLQYRPAASFTTAAADIARLEAVHTHLTKSYALWDGYIEDRGSIHDLGANDVAAAVASMTAVTREMVAAQSALPTSPRSRNASSVQAATSVPPTPTMPDPRRY